MHRGKKRSHSKKQREEKRKEETYLLPLPRDQLIALQLLVPLVRQRLLLLPHRWRALILRRPRRPSVGAPLLPLRHHLALLLSAQLSLDHGNLLETALFLPLIRNLETMHD